MAAHSSVLAWRIPGTGKPGGLPAMGSHRVGHDWSDAAAAAAAVQALLPPCSILKWKCLFCTIWGAVGEDKPRTLDLPSRRDQDEPHVPTVKQRKNVQFVVSGGCLVAKSCPTLCDPVDYSWPGSLVREILQARILKWIAMSFSRESARPRDWTRISCIAGGFSAAEPPGKSAICMVSMSLIGLEDGPSPFRTQGAWDWGITNLLSFVSFSFPKRAPNSQILGNFSPLEFGNRMKPFFF